MIFTRSSPKPIEKVSSDNIVISFDLLSNLSYMACLAAAQLPREALLLKAGEQPLMTAVFFREVHKLAQRLGFEYTKALQFVAEHARAQNVKSLLLRFASTISSGESEYVFIQQENGIERRRYINEYQRSVETLKKWTDAYAAILVSVTLIVVVALVSNLTGTMGQGFVVVMAVAMAFITTVGVFIIKRTSPYEEMTYGRASAGPPDRRKSRFLFLTLGSIGLVLSVFVAFRFGFGGALLTAGIFLAPAGYYASRDDKKVTKIDNDIASFIRTLGSIAGTTGTTLSSAIQNIDVDSTGALQPHIVRLQNRLANQLPTDICWEQFKTETGSELVRRSTGMLVDGVELGADPEKVAEIASSYSLSVAELRGLRQQTASTFSYLVVPMHVSMTGLLVFIFEIVATFNDHLEDVAKEVLEQSVFTDTSSSTSSSLQIGMEMFQPHDLAVISNVIILVVLVLTVANSLAPKFASGGHPLKLTRNFSLLCIFSGLILLIVPKVASALFAM